VNLDSLEMRSIRRALLLHRSHCTAEATGSCDGPTEEEYERAAREVRAEAAPPSLFGMEEAK